MRPFRIVPFFDAVGMPLVALVGAALATVEAARPLRERRVRRAERWVTNARMGALAGAVVRLAIVPTVNACARGAAERNVGVLRWLPLPRAARAALGFVALDYSMYLWHRALHGVPLLWRSHAVHHVDRDLDVTTALRFHVGELAASVPFRAAQTVLLGVGPRVALVYELAMQAAALFHHSNVRLPARVDRALARVFVTPRMHGVHHSTAREELASNWGVVFAVWDRLHGTARWRATPPDIGLLAENAPGGVAPSAVAQERGRGLGRVSA